MKPSPLFFTLIVGLLLAMSCIGGLSSADANDMHTLNLVPWPKSVVRGQGAFFLKNDARIIVEDPALQPQAEGLHEDMLRVAGKHLAIFRDAPRAGDIALSLAPEAFQGEAYSLCVNEMARIVGGSAQAVAWGTATLLQAIEVNASGDAHIPLMTVRDKPDYPVRRLRIAMSQNYRSIDDLKSYIAIGRLYKVHAELGFDVIYLGDVNWNRPAPTDKTVWSGRYSPEQMDELRTFARARGIALSANLPVSSHWLQKEILSYYPDLQKAAQEESQANNTLLVDTEAFWKAVDRHLLFITENFDSLYVGIGETAEKPGFSQPRALDEQIQTLLKKYGLRDRNDYWRWFAGRIAQHVLEAGLIPMLWAGYDTVPDPKSPYNLPTGLVMQYYTTDWGRPEPFVRAGHPILNSSQHPYYIGASQQDVYEWNPRGMGRRPVGPPEYMAPENATVLGSQLAVWKCHAGRAAFDVLRELAPAMAERLWTEDIDRGYIDFARRYAATDELLERLVYGMSIDAKGLKPVEAIVNNNAIHWFAERLKIHLSTRIPGANIRYLCGDGDMTTDSTLYTEPIVLENTTQFRAQVFGPDGAPAGILYDVTYELHPIEARAEGLFEGLRFTTHPRMRAGRPNTFHDSMTLKLHAPQLAKTKGCIRVSLDGSRPGPKSPIYEDPITITKTTTVRARLFDAANRPVGAEWSIPYVKYADRGFHHSLTTGQRATCKEGSRLGLAIDGMQDDPHQFFHSTWPTWFQVEWDEPQSINSVQVFFWWQGNKFYQYQVETSLNAKDWTIVVDASKNRELATRRGNMHQFDTVKAKYIRLAIPRASGNSRVGIVEFHAFGPQEHN